MKLGWYSLAISAGKYTASYGGGARVRVIDRARDSTVVVYVVSSIRVKMLLSVSVQIQSHGEVIQIYRCRLH